MKNLLRTLSCLFLGLLFAAPVQAQTPVLSIQGILRKANGAAVPDGEYRMIFELYDDPAAGNMVWTETKDGVEVTNGIYSTTLGSPTTPLDAAFDKPYYLQVSINSTSNPILPRTALSSAPYAFALKGVNNTFPSTGPVQADGYLAKGGTPGMDGANNQGYAFTGNDGDKDSGMFSTGDGKVALYTDSVQRLLVTHDSVFVDTTLIVEGHVEVGHVEVADSVALGANAMISYNGLSDWRLIERDGFETDAEGWAAYKPALGMASVNPVRQELSANTGGPGGFGAEFVISPVNFVDVVLRKKLENLPPHTYVKIVFNYHIFDTWDEDENEIGFGGFADSSRTYSLNRWVFSGFDKIQALGSGTSKYRHGLGSINGEVSTGGVHFQDFVIRGEMTIKNSDPAIFILFGSNLDDNGNERFGLSDIEIWVR